MKTKKFLLTSIILMSIFLPQHLLIYISPLLIAALLLMDYKWIRFVKNKTILFLFVLLVIIQPVLIGEKDILFWGIGISSASFISGLSMFLRGVLVISTFQTINRTMPKEKLFGFWKIIGIMNFDEVFETAKLIFPKLRKRVLSAIGQSKKRIYLKSPLTIIAEIIALTMNEAHSAEVENIRVKE